jgi:hypothetical protein
MANDETIGMRLSGDEQAAYTDFQNQVELYGSNCADSIPSPWVDYGDDDEPFREPSAVDAMTLCSGCPVFNDCAIFAAHHRPKHGVWAGIKWRNGRESKWGRRA